MEFQRTGQFWDTPVISLSCRSAQMNFLVTKPKCSLRQPPDNQVVMVAETLKEGFEYSSGIIVSKVFYNLRSQRSRKEDVGPCHLQRHPEWNRVYPGHLKIDIQGKSRSCREKYNCSKNCCIWLKKKRDKISDSEVRSNLGEVFFKKLPEEHLKTILCRISKVAECRYYVFSSYPKMEIMA